MNLIDQPVLCMEDLIVLDHQLESGMVHVRDLTGFVFLSFLPIN